VKREIRAAFLFAGVSLCSSCSFFSRPLPLPRHAAIESTGPAEKFSALVQDADIIYFPSESAHARRSETAWKLLEAFQRTGNSFALGCDLIGEDEETHRAFIAKAKNAGAQIIAVRAPGSLMAEEISRGFEPPAGDFARFARRPSFRGLSEAKVRVAYEAALLAEEFAAAKIAGYFAEHRSEKILVFFHREQLGRDDGVPFFVAQKTKARQLVLDPKPRSVSGPRLMARNGAGLDGLGRRLEIVDRAPLAAGDERRFTLPRTAAGEVVRFLFLAPE
jgi:hypothetical protein